MDDETVQEAENLDEGDRSLNAPFAEGELCLLIDPKGRRHTLRLDRRQHFHHPRFGRLDHSEIIGKPAGFRLKGPHLSEVTCLRPTLDDYIMSRLKRRTQIIYPKDLGPLLLWGDIFPGARVLESGIGSGSATLVLMRYLCGGELISYERREEFAQLTLRTLSEFQSLYGKLATRHKVEVRDVYEGIDERDLDAILLDVPEPHQAVQHAAQALRPGGNLLSWLPTTLQVYTLVRALQQAPCWSEILTREVLVRPWDVSEGSIRPAHRMVAHTGFLIRARRVEPLELASAEPVG